MFDLEGIQSALGELKLDGWLLYDFRGTNVLAQRVLQIAPDAVGSRRLMYFIPAEGEPRKLVHRIEDTALDHLPGAKQIYLSWQELGSGIFDLVEGQSVVAMEYAPEISNPYISRVDAGTVEFVRSCGVEVRSSGDLVQLFEARWDASQWEMHQEAAQHTHSAFARAWAYIAEHVRAQGSVEESAVREEIMRHFAEHDMVTYHPPIVALGPHSGLPHYETGTGPGRTAIQEGDLVLIDLWAKLDRPRGVYSDLTRMGFVGETVPQKYQDVFDIVAAARDASIDLVRTAMSSGRPLHGWEVDQAARDVIEQAGYGEYFTHRTGHSIGEETHGNGANMDNLETRDDRRVLPGTCFSIEPGIYLPEFGIRSEVNVFVDFESTPHVTGGLIQTGILPILGDPAN